MNVHEDDDMRVAKHRPSKFPEVEEELVNWLVKMKQQNTLLTDALIRNKAKETARNLQIPEERFKASSGWVENFKHRHNIRKGVWLGAHKTLRAARGVGATHLRKGSNESVLSPLNPAFESRSEALAGRGSTHAAEDGEEDMESEDEQDLDPPHDSQPVAGPSHSQTESPACHHPLPPIWTMHHEPLSSNDTPITSHPSASQHNVLPQQPFPPHEERHHEVAVTNMHQNPLQLPAQHISVSQPQQVSLPSHEDTTTTYTDPVVVYQPAPPITSGNTVPDIAEVEDAINKVILFVDSQSPTLLTPEERGALTQIKYALFQAASGVPFVRERR
ncbi:CenpB-DNA-bind-domain-containing protein [Gyrodon lividus]|nr:CenpB-DNA-bind-domain-containing protein [Gyrodon lividus]